MLRRNQPGHIGGTTTVYVPEVFRNRYVDARARRYNSNRASLCLPGYRERHFYGGCRHRRRPPHRHYWRHSHPKEAEEDELEEKQRQEEKEKLTLKDEDLDKLEALSVKKLNLGTRRNALDHHTTRYQATKGGKEADAVLRRGQEFTVKLRFNRPFNKEQDDLFFVLEAEKGTVGKNLSARFQLDEDGTDTYRQDQDWGARIVQDEGRKKMVVAIYIPPDCVVGEWDLSVVTAMQGQNTDYVYECPQSLFILFNPWCADDQTHFTGDKKELDEYVLNDVSSVYRGCASSIGRTSWTYGQFEKGILEICLDILKKAFGFKMTPSMADPVLVARALSKITNHSGGGEEEGVLVGNWSGHYEGGQRPTSWTGSVGILSEFGKTGRPVKYGQCWVFSHVLTTVCRALGLPCRSVTNFDSAHDTDNTCTIDCYYYDGEEKKNLKTDSIWNFHVWNEVWMCRPDLGQTYDGQSYDGWHVIDATPQEQSNGVFQCGPCPVAAVKRGQIDVGYDTAFVFSEVNACIVHWIVDHFDQIVKKSSVRKNQVGNKLSTKIPDGKPGKPMNYYNRSGDRLDLTDEYKFPVDSKEFEDAVKRAVRFTKHGDKLFQCSQDLDVTFDLETQTLIGQDLVVTAYVKNVTSEDKEVEVLMSCRTCRYWNHQDNDKCLVKETKPKVTLKAGETESFQVTVPYDQYMKECDENYNFYVYACAFNTADSMPFSAQNPFRLRRPDLDTEGPEEAKSGDPITVDVSFTNPLRTALTNCSLQFTGNLDVRSDDKNKVEPLNDWVSEIRAKDVQPGEEFKVTMCLEGDVDPDEDGRCLHMDYEFTCDEFTFSVTGSYCVVMHAK